MSIASKGGERIRALMAVVALGLAGADCGSSHNSSVSGVGGAGGSNQPVGDGGINSIDGHMITGVSNPPLTTPAVALEGGAAPSMGGQAQAGGLVHLVSGGGITIGPDFQAPAMPASQTAPAGTAPLAASSLSADVNATGSIAITGGVESRGGDGVRQITAAGDIFVDGTLRGADLGGARQGLTLKANGTVYVSGNLDTSGTTGAGQAGGALTIIAQQLIVTGKIMTAGGSGVAGGAAGALTIDTSGGAYFGGVVDASGGDANGMQAVTAGRGGDLSLKAGGDVLFAGAASFHGGAASTMGANAVQGGAAGNLTVDTVGTVAFTGALDDRGGLAEGDAGSPSAVAGAAGALKIGENARPAMIGMTVPLLLTGGDGQAVGGGGGTVQLEPHGGDLRVSGLLNASGGDSSVKPGPGGPIDGHPGPENAAANLDVSGQIVTNGGSIAKGSSGDGAMGGTIKLVQRANNGNLTIEPTGQVQTDGGSSGGTGTAGGGGLLYTFTMSGNYAGHGKQLARGGAAPDPGGTGGGGGLIYVFTGDGHDGKSGELVIEGDGILDASGGAGAIGGSARNNGALGVGAFPSVQTDEYDVEKIAVLINSDGVHGTDHGWIDNRGQIVVRGGKTNGNGGDVAFHGRQSNGNEKPLPGKIDLSGDGSGASGSFAGE
jgi:hypothetical protein